MSFCHNVFLFFLKAFSTLMPRIEYPVDLTASHLTGLGKRGEILIQNCCQPYTLILLKRHDYEDYCDEFMKLYPNEVKNQANLIRLASNGEVIIQKDFYGSPIYRYCVMHSGSFLYSNDPYVVNVSYIVLIDYIFAFNAFHSDNFQANCFVIQSARFYHNYQFKNVF